MSDEAVFQGLGWTKIRQVKRFFTCLMVFGMNFIIVVYGGLHPINSCVPGGLVVERSASRRTAKMHGDQRERFVAQGVRLDKEPIGVVIGDNHIGD